MGENMNNIDLSISDMDFNKINIYIRIQKTTNSVYRQLYLYANRINLSKKAIYVVEYGELPEKNCKKSVSKLY